MMIRVLMVVVAVAAMVVAGIAVRGQEKTGGAGEYAFSGPMTHENLTIFLIHGADAVKGRTYLSLSEAMEQKKLTVYETESVNELQVENTSATEDVFIQAGEIVKGGKQDRCLGVDMIVQAKSGKVPIAAFCVENGRWTQRGGEELAKFGSSENMVAGNSMKLATTYVPSATAPAGGAGSRPATGQSAVWDQVAANQEKLSGNTGLNVDALQSKTSFQLTLEDAKVKEAVGAYVKDLQGAVTGKGDVIGFAVVINGKVRTVDVYASNGLFLKLWGKMLDSAATQAVAELEKGKTFAAGGGATAEDVKKFMAATAGGTETKRDVNGRVEMQQVDSDKVVQFRSLEKAAPAAGGAGGGRGAGSSGPAVHQSWVGK